MSDKTDSLKFFRGCMFGMLFVLPMWVGVYMLTTWLINR